MVPSKPELMKMCAEGHGKRKRCSGGGMRPLYSVQEEVIAQRILHPRELHASACIAIDS